MSTCKYILDTNIILAAYHDYYAFDIAPSFWDRLNETAARGEWALINEVREELIKQDDDISSWIKREYGGCVLDSKEIVESYGHVITEAYTDKRYRESAKEVFASSADSWLVAHGLASGLCVVTQEKFDEKARKRIMIPNECHRHNVECINTYDFMRRVGIRI